MGRWLTRDPDGYDGGMDLYAYCMNDPVNGVDPSGLLTWNDIQNLLARGRDGAIQIIAGHSGDLTDAVLLAPSRFLDAVAINPLPAGRGDFYKFTKFVSGYTDEQMNAGPKNPVFNVQNTGKSFAIVVSLAELGQCCSINIKCPNLFARTQVCMQFQESSGANNVAEFELYKAKLRIQMEKPYVEDTNLAEMIDQIK